jgi:hypothetical protein
MKKSNVVHLRRRIAILGALLGVLAWERSFQLVAAERCSTCQSRYITCSRICLRIDPRIQTNCDENCAINFEQCRSTCK